MNTHSNIADARAFSKNVLDRAHVLREQEESIYGDDLTKARHRRLIAMNFIMGELPVTQNPNRARFTPEMLAAIELTTLALQLINGSEKLSALAAAAKEIDVLADYLGYSRAAMDNPNIEAMPSVVTGIPAVDPDPARVD